MAKGHLDNTLCRSAIIFLCYSNLRDGSRYQGSSQETSRDMMKVWKSLLMRSKFSIEHSQITWATEIVAVPPASLSSDLPHPLHPSYEADLRCVSQDK